MVTEVEALAKVEATWPELDSWRVRLGEPFAPEIGSELEVDHVDWPPMPVAQVAWDGLISAVMHLHAVRIHLEPSSPAKPEPPRWIAGVHSPHETATACSRRREEADGAGFEAGPPPHVGGYTLSQFHAWCEISGLTPFS